MTESESKATSVFDPGFIYKQAGGGGGVGEGSQVPGSKACWSFNAPTEIQIKTQSLLNSQQDLGEPVSGSVAREDGN